MSHPSYLPPAAPPPPRNPSRAPLILASVFAGLLFLGVALAPLLPSHDDGSSADAAGAGSTSLDEVRTYDITDRTHTDKDVDYDQSPPVGGPHRPDWLDCGVYDEPVTEEFVVHDLEHGTVWITYDPEQVDEDGIATLKDALPDNGILSPYPGLDSPVAVTVWNNQLRLTGPQDEGLAAFIREYGDGHTAAEASVGCFGGTAGATEDSGIGV